MSSEHNNGPSQENWQLVRAILNKHWDPLGVADLVDDEYDFYVGTICLMLIDPRISESEISRYLQGIETGPMGLTPNPISVEGCGRTAAILNGLRPWLETH
jgi:hypothetical protein